MGLEAPLALLGLLAAGIPFIVHRLRRTDPIERLLPTFRLLERAEASRKRARTLTDRMLLALRVALLALAAIALSTPFVTARVPFGDGTVAATAVVLDDSMSMLRERRGGTLLAEGLARAREAIGSLPDGSEVSVVLAGRPARVLVARTDDLRAADAALDEPGLDSARGTDLEAGLRLALREVRGSTLGERRVLVLSDFAPHAAFEADARTIGDVDVLVEAIGDAAPATNAYVARAEVMRSETAGMLDLEVEVRVSGEAPGTVPVSLVQGDRELARADVTLSEGSGVTRLRAPATARSADPSAELRLEIDDALDADDRAAVLLAPPRAVELLVVNGDPRPASDDDELHYLLQALALVPEEHGAVSVRAVDAEAFPRHELTGTDVVLLANVPAPDAALAARLRDFVRGGGGLVVAGGDRVVPRAYVRALGDVLPCRIAAVAGGREARLAGAEPSSLLPHGSLGLGRAVARTILQLEPVPEARVLLRFADGEPAVVTGDAGHGRASVLATSLDDDWSDLPLRPGYLPLVWGLVRDAARLGGATAKPVDPGLPATLDVPPGATQVEVVAPDGARERFDALGDAVTVSFRGTSLPGAYRVLAGSRSGTLRDVPQGGFVVRAPVEESVLSPQTLPEIALERGAEPSARATVRRPLSPWFFLACALFALGEGWLRSRRR